MDVLANLSLTEITAHIRDGSVTSEQATSACLARIEKHDGTINAFIAVGADRALEQARQADKHRSRGLRLPPLHGVPLAHKDMFYRRGEESTNGSAIRRGWMAPVTADVLQRLDGAGSVTLGRLGMSEFAVGPIGLNAHYGPVRNPWNAAHVSGGSSSGPGAAVAARFCFGALGSDTGASIRVPAAACGVAGLKPTRGRISTSGSMPLSSTLDVAGPLARTVADVALLTAVLATPADETLAIAAHPEFLDITQKPQARLGVPANFFTEELHPEIEKNFRAAVEVFRHLGFSIETIDASVFASAGGIYRTIFGAEASSVHAGLLATRAQDYAPQVRARLKAGLEVPRAAYLAALEERARLIQRAATEVYSKVAAVLAPVLSMPVPTIAEVDVGDSPEMAKVISGFLRLTCPINVLGLPALSVPSGFTSNGLPAGIQLIGPAWSEAKLLAVGHAYEQACDWRNTAPPL